MKRISALLLLLVLTAVLCGCTTPWNDLDNCTLIRLIGLDVDEQGNFILCVLATEPSDRGKSGSPSPVCFTGSGASLTQAMLMLNLSSVKTPFWGFADFLLISRRLAESGLADDCFSVFIRQYKLRLSMQVAMLDSDEPMSSILTRTVESGLFMAQDLEELFRTVGENPFARRITLRNALVQLSRPTSSFMLNVVTAHNDGGVTESQLQAKPLWFSLGGYAVMRFGRLVALADEGTALGLNVLTPELFRGSLVTLQDRHGRLCTVELKNFTVKCRVRDGRLVYQVDCSAEIGEYHDHAKLGSEEEQSFVTSAVAAALRRDVDKALALVRRTGADLLNFSQQLRLARQPFSAVEAVDVEVNIGVTLHRLHTPKGD